MTDPDPAAEATVRLSIILATLNERPTLPALLDRIQSLALPAYEVLVIDDGSTDGTREFLTERASRDPHLRPIFHDGKQTTLRAQAQGIRAARGAWVVVMDADLQHPPETIPALLAGLSGGAALVIASRYVAGGSVGERSAVRAFLSRGAEWLAKIELRDARGRSDPVSGYFAFRRDIYVDLDPEYRGYKLLLFVLVMAHGRRVAEVGFRFAERAEGSSKVTHGSPFIRVFLHELRLARRLARSMRRAGGAPPAPAPQRTSSGR
jgi:dolichol-phosphate mannosyltransferase